MPEAHMPKPDVSGTTCTIERRSAKIRRDMTRHAGLPMSLGNMRSLGATQVDIYCGCGDHASVDVSALPDDLAVPDVRLRLRCTKCGKRPNETRPDWTRYRAKGRL